MSETQTDYTHQRDDVLLSKSIFHELLQCPFRIAHSSLWASHRCAQIKMSLLELGVPVL
jgi:hypothetical protein